MSKISRNIITVAAVILVFGIMIFYGIFKASRGRLPDNVIGNTPGNLMQSGLFCESGDTVFFANPYDNNFLYSMRPDQSDITRLSTLSTKYINAGGDFAFFYGESVEGSTGLGNMVSKPGIFKYDTSAKKLRQLSRDYAETILLAGNTLYFQSYSTSYGIILSKYDLKTEKASELTNFNVNPSSYSDGLLYYSDFKGGRNLYVFNPVTLDNTYVWGGDIWNPVYYNGFLYYMDVQNNYRLCRYSITNNTIEVLANERVDLFNVYDNMIYYQKSSQTKPMLKRMMIDGSNNEEVADGTFDSIHMTSTYTYFSELNSDVMYYTPTFGSVYVQEFTAAREAAYKAKSN